MCRFLPLPEMGVRFTQPKGNGRSKQPSSPIDVGKEDVKRRVMMMMTNKETQTVSPRTGMPREYCDWKCEFV